MKKLIILIIFTLTLSCSKDDDTSGELPKTIENLTGKWKMSTVIKNDGTTQNYVGLCPTKNGVIEFFIYYKISGTHFYQDCTTYDIDTQNDFFIENEIFRNCIYDLNDAKITSLSANTLRIEYDSPKTLSYADHSNVKALVLIRL